MIFKQQVALVEGKHKTPTRCPTKSCNSKNFSPIFDSTFTKSVDWQKIKQLISYFFAAPVKLLKCYFNDNLKRLQEVFLDQRDFESGRIPRTIECELTEDLTGTCMPGDMVTVNGIVKALNLETAGVGRSTRDKATFVIYISVNSMKATLSSCADDNSAAKKDNNGENSLEFTQKEMDFFKSLQNEADLFRCFQYVPNKNNSGRLVNTV